MMNLRKRFWLMAGVAITIGLALRLWFIHHYALITGDSLLYGDIAKNWLQHGVYGFSDINAAGIATVRPTLIRLPGYPLFLAACFRLFGLEHYTAVLYVQAAIDLATCCLLAALAGRLFGHRAAMAVLWLAALCPFTAGYTAAPLTETLTLSAMALAFYAFVRWWQSGCGINRWIWLLGLVLGWSVLLRPEQGLLWIALLPAAWLAAGKIRGQPLSTPSAASPVLITALCAVLPLVPWTARNWHTFHILQPLAPRNAVDPGELDPVGFNRWFRTWGIEFQSTEQIYWNYSGFPIQLNDLPLRAFDAGSPGATAALHAQTAALLADYNKTTLVTPQIDARFAALARIRISAHPVLYYIGLPLARLLDMALRPRTELLPTPLDWWRWRIYHGQTVFAATYAALNLIYLALGVGGFLVWQRRRWRAADSAAHNMRPFALALAATVLLRALLLLALDNSEPRYTLEFFPVALIFAGALFASPRTTSVRSGTSGTPAR
ncbi:MAG TPA: glycosyltransferase family 39 protein [Acidobacteriaceae bacterium]|nr:glycosyltransferase family 39 protein [Acidobacteriaceae bacterium]